MKVQLLLLFALAGTFSSIAHASTLVVPTDVDRSPTEVVHTIPAEKITPFQTTEEITRPSQTAKEITTPFQTVEEVSNQSTALTTAPAAQTSPAWTDAPEASTEIPVTTIAVVTEKTEPGTTQATHVATEDASTADPTPATGTSLPQEADVVIEDGMSTGNVVGIIFAVLVAMAVLIAIIVVVVRRMGQYSP